MDKPAFQPGDKVVLKNNSNIVYVFLSLQGNKALCLTPDNTEIELHLVAIKKYTGSTVRIRGIG